MDFDELLNEVENVKKRNSPFVIYRKPKSKELTALFQKTSELQIFQNYSEIGFVFAPFEDRQKTIIFALDNCDKLDTKFEVEDFKIEDVDSIKPHFKINTSSHEKHISLVKKGLDLIENKVVSKVVLSRKEKLELKKIDLKLIFKRLLFGYPLAFVYIWYHPRVGLWIGATPETLLKVEGDKFKTMALAGTQNYDNKQNITWAEKEKEEQQIVTDYIVDKLSKEKLNVGRPFTLKAGSLVHICTEITGDLTSKNHLERLIDKLHPTPAICGLPTDGSKKFILDQEGYDREYYTGFLGELNFNNITDLFVNLRCMQIGYHCEKIIANLYIGGGITKDSDPEKEWEETVSKSEILKQVLMGLKK